MSPIRGPPALQHFPISNVRGSTDVALPSEFIEPTEPSRKIRLKSLKGPKDHLTRLPPKNHRYVTYSGKTVQDPRYTQPLKAENEPKQPREKAYDPSKSGAEPNRSPSVQLEPVHASTRLPCPHIHIYWPWAFSCLLGLPYTNCFRRRIPSITSQ